MFDLEGEIAWLVARQYRRRASGNVVVQNSEYSFNSEVRGYARASTDGQSLDQPNDGLASRRRRASLFGEREWD